MEPTCISAFGMSAASALTASVIVLAAESSLAEWKVRKNVGRHRHLRGSGSWKVKERQ